MVTQLSENSDNAEVKCILNQNSMKADKGEKGWKISNELQNKQQQDTLNKSRRWPVGNTCGLFCLVWFFQEISHYMIYQQFKVPVLGENLNFHHK